MEISKNKKIILISTFSFLILALSSACAGAYFVGTLPESEFVSRTGVPQMSFSGYGTFAEAASALTARDAEWLNQKVTFTSQNGNAELTLKEIGVEPWPAEGLINYNLNLLEKIEIYLMGRTFDHRFTLNAETAKAAFLPFNIEQGNASAELVYADGTISIKPEQIGYGIDTATLQMLMTSLWESAATLTTLELPLRTSVPEFLAADYEPLLSEAQKIAEETLILTDSYGNDYELPMAENISWFVPGHGATGTIPAVLIISQDKFISYVELNLSESIEEDPMPVTITDDLDGTYSFEGSARFGVAIDRPTLLLEIENALAPATAETVPEQETGPILIPTTQTAPQITVPDSLKAQGVTDLLEFGYSDFSGSPANRIHNIQTGIAQFNGITVAKDAEFSFMGQMSPVDAANGFLPELVIKGNETIPEYGGGLCQISSTMFRAVIYTGLPIVARTNHSYAVAYYARPFGYGLDATVYDPAPDLKFKNDTPAPILIQSYTDGNSAYFVFYGSNNGRRVEMDGPYSYNYNSIGEPVIEYTDELAPGERKQKEYAHKGFTTDWYRTIYYADGTTLDRELIHSVYEARPAKYLEGTGTTEDITGANAGSNNP
jgi:vancomycin resistance protein YoaR